MIKVELQSWMGDDKAIAEAAWTSSFDYIKKQGRTDADVEKVVKLLADSKHSVPFESVLFRFWYKLPIAIDRQHMTHRIASHSGMSGRYRTMPGDWLNMPQDVKDIIEQTEGPDLSMMDLEYDLICERANKWYGETSAYFKGKRDEGLITPAQYKRVREFTRGVLPQHNMTERVTIMNLRSFSNYYKLRSKMDAQPEIQNIAEQMLAQVEDSKACPIAIKALKDNDWAI